jgi:hypothetical protein
VALNRFFQSRKGKKDLKSVSKTMKRSAKKVKSLLKK